MVQNSSQQFGSSGEDIAAIYLEKCGYSIVEKNYRTKLGEIDIIAKDKDTIVFIEVKSRRSNHFGSPKLAITPQKQQKISMVALYYLKSTKQTKVKARFDVVTISFYNGTPQIELITNAFQTKAYL